MKAHVPGQLMCPSPLVTVPVLEPVVLTVNANSGENVAVTATADVPIVKLHVPVPVQAPVQPANTKPDAGVAVSVTVEPVLIVALQVPGQLIPLPATVPEPDTVTFTENELGMKSALTDSAELIVTEQAPVPVQAPLQPLNTEPTLAVGVSVTTVPLSKSAAHVAPQDIPAGALLIDPEPVTDVDRVNFGRGAGPNVAVTF